MKPKFLLLFIAVALSAILFWRYYSVQPDAPTVDLAPPTDVDTDQLPPLATAIAHNFTPEYGQVSVQPDKTDLNSAAYSSSQSKEPLVPIYLGDKPFQVSIADSQAEWVKGLSGSPQLPFGEGKLFIFDKAAKHGIWMKDMLFALDIIWLNESGKIIHIASNVAPESFPDVFRPPTVARFVLEVPAGTVSASGISLDDQIVIDSFYLTKDLQR